MNLPLEVSLAQKGPVLYTNQEWDLPSGRHNSRVRLHLLLYCKLLPQAPRKARHGDKEFAEEVDSDEDGERIEPRGESTARFRSLFPGWAPSKYARRRQSIQLPPGVKHPGTFIKDMAPVKVEPKVWLANQRTFIKWQHVTVLLATLSLGLYNAAGPQNNVARILAVVYTLIAVFAGVWGWWIYMVRSRLIMERSGKDFDNIFGPVVVCISLAVALCLNFAFKYRAAIADSRDHGAVNGTLELSDFVSSFGSQTLKLVQQGQ